MNWKLIIVVSLCLSTIYMLVLLASYAVGIWIGGISGWLAIRSGDLAITILGFIAGLLISLLGARAIVKRISSRLFLHGFLVGGFGCVMFVVELVFPVSMVLCLFIGQEDPGGFGQAIGILAAFILFFGTPVAALVMGAATWSLGKYRDRKEIVQPVAPIHE